MYKGYFFICSLFFFWGSVFFPTTKPLTLVIVDSANHDVMVYNEFIALAKSVGFTVAHQSIADIIDRKNNYNALMQADAVFFMISIEFLKSMHHSAVAQAYLKLIEQCAAKPQKLIGLFFPSLGNAVVQPASLAALWKTLGVSFNTQGKIAFADRGVDKFLQAATSLINHSLESRSVQYHTTLNAPRIGKSVGILQSDLEKDVNVFAALPIQKTAQSRTKNDFESVIKSLLPFGLYWYNPLKKNNVLISYSALTTFLGVSENYQLCPTNLLIRYKLYAALQRFLWEVKALFGAQQAQPNVFCKGVCPRRIQAKKITKIPAGLHIVTPQLPQHKKIGAWMELTIFEADADPLKQAERIQKQKELITYIVTAQLEYLWVSFLPNMYYSPIGRNAEKKQTFLKSVGTFTKLLKQEAHAKKMRIPKIFVGFEIVNNLVDAHQPQQCAYDLYANKFADVPQPLDHTFWMQEVINPLALFVKDFMRPEVCNGLPLAGVILDLEMYGRKTTGAFLSTMIGNQPIQTVLQQGALKKHFEGLRLQAAQLGKKLKEDLKKILPGAGIGCYAPNVSLDWFYQGFFKGISSAHDPLLFLTFNMLYHPYKNNLEQKGVFTEHATVLMLSKINSPADFSWINFLLTYQQGLWLNRFSRLVEPYQKNSWIGVEQTPMVKQGKFGFCKALAAVK